MFFNVNAKMLKEKMFSLREAIKKGAYLWKSSIRGLTPPPYFRELWNRCYTFAKTFFLVLFNVFNGESGEGVHRREVVDKVPFQKSFKNHIFVTKITCLSTVP